MLVAGKFDRTHRIANIGLRAHRNQQITSTDPAQFIAKCAGMAIDQDAVIAKQSIAIGKLIGCR